MGLLTRREDFGLGMCSSHAFCYAFMIGNEQ